MTYVPPPHQPPQGPLGVDYRQPLDAPGPARRASVMMWVLGTLGALCGVCIGSAFWILPVDQLVAQFKANMSQEELNQIGGLNLGQIVRAVYTAMGVFSLVISIVILVLAGFVRKASRGATITAVVIFVLISIVAALGVLVCALEAIVKPVTLILAVIWLVIGSVVGLTLVWLVQSLRAPDQSRLLQMEYLRMQQRAAAQNPGFGYGTPPNWPQQALGPIPPPPQKDVNPPPPPA